MEIATIDLSVSIALIALFYTIREIKRSNNIIVKVKKCSSGFKQSIDENNTQRFFFFEIMIQNKGVNLYCPKMSLSFTCERGGTLNLPLKQKVQTVFSMDTFSKGMITSFHFKTYELDEGALDFLNHLRDTRKQNACLCLYSQNYLAKEFQINSFADKLKQKWNKFSYKLLFTRKKNKKW